MRFPSLWQFSLTLLLACLATCGALAQPPREYSRRLLEAGLMAGRGDHESAVKLYREAWTQLPVQQRTAAATLAFTEQVRPLLTTSDAKNVIESDMRHALNEILNDGDQTEKWRAGYHLASLELQNGKPQQAVEIFQQHVFKDRQTPSVERLFELHYNFGVACEKTGDMDSAIEQYWSAFRDQPKLLDAARAVYELLLKQEPKYYLAAELVQRLQDNGQAELSGEMLFGFLQKWGSEPDAEYLARGLIRNLVVADVDRSDFLSNEVPRLEQLAKLERMKPLVDELRRVYGAAPFEELPMPPEFLSNAEVLSLFPTMRRILSAWGKTDNRFEDLSRLLEHGGRGFSRQITRREENGSTNAKRALQRYGAAFALDVRNTSAALGACGVLTGSGNRDKELDSLAVNFLSLVQENKAASLEMADTLPNRVNFMRIHAAYGEFFDRLRPIGEPALGAAIAQFELALRDEAAIQVRFGDHQFRAPAAVREKLGLAYSSHHDPRGPRILLAAAEQYADLRASERAREVLHNAEEAAVTRNMKWSPWEERSLDSLHRAIENVDNVKFRASHQSEDPVEFVRFLQPTTVELAAGGWYQDWNFRNRDVNDQIAFAKRGTLETLVVYSADGRWRASVQDSGAIILFDRIKKIRQSLPGRQGEEVTGLAFETGFEALGGQTRFLAAAYQGEVVIWELEKRTRAARFEIPPSKTPPRLVLTEGGKFLVGAFDRQLAVWEVSEKARPTTRFEMDTPCTALLFDPRRFQIITAHDSHGEVWDLRREARINSFGFRHPNVNLLKFHPSGDWFVTATPQGNVSLWGAEFNEWASLYSRAGASTISFAEGKLIAVGGKGGVEVWEHR